MCDPPIESAHRKKKKNTYIFPPSNMTSNKWERWPIKITYFFLFCVGFGVAKNKNDRILLNISLCSFLSWSFASLYFATTNFYVRMKQGVISETIGASFPLITVSLTNFKLITFTLQRAPYERLLRLTNETLWIQRWTEYGKIVLEKCDKQAAMFFFIFVVLAHASGVGWILEPILLNMKANSSDPVDRHIPIEPILGLPVYESPNYEFIFVTDGIGVYITTILYFCFDYYLVLVNIFVAGQFDILRQRFEVVYAVRQDQWSLEAEDNSGKNLQKYIVGDYILQEFKNCVKQHQFLISLVEDIEGVYSIMNLGQVLLLSLIICLVGYPLLMPGGSVLTSFKNGIFVISCVIQLFIFTVSCHNIMIASSDISSGIYCSRWYNRNNTEEGRSLSKNFMIVLMKTKYPCYLTGGKFFFITTETLKSILTTAFSYLTLMRQSMDK